MFFLPIMRITSVDASIGRVDKSSLSQNTLMELFSEGIPNKDVICRRRPPLDISDWIEVNCDSDNHVREIVWFQSCLHGTINLQWLPSTVQCVLLSHNSLTGTVDLTCLPDAMYALALHNNQFYSSIDLTKLPSAIHSLFLGYNKFSGLTDFAELPQSLRDLDVCHTEMEGEVHQRSDTSYYVNDSKVRIIG